MLLMFTSDSESKLNCSSPLNNITARLIKTNVYFVSKLRLCNKNYNGSWCGIIRCCWLENDIVCYGGSNGDSGGPRTDCCRGGNIDCIVFSFSVPVCA